MVITMIKYMMYPLLAYVIVCVIVILISASEGYNVASWKLFVGQIYAIPILIITALISCFLYKKIKQ